MRHDDATPLEQRVLDAVKATGEAFTTIPVDPSLADTAEFCAHYGYPLETSANCILVASKDPEPVMAACLVLATTRLDVNKRVRKLLGVRKLSFAPPELTHDVTGMEIGGVTPFGLPQATTSGAALPLWMDARIEQLDRVVVGGGSRRIKLEVPPSALRATGAEPIEDLALDA